MKRALAALALTLCWQAPFARAAPDLGRPFVPTPISQALYGVQDPSENPPLQRHIIEASDGVKLFIETWLPKEMDGNIPPASIPTVLVVTPYVKQGVVEAPGLLNAIVPRGYAYSQLHVRGTGESGGCLENHSPQEVDDAARAIEYLGRDAPWSNGIVGGYGFSYPGGSMFAVAAEGDPAKTGYLKAIVIGDR